MEHLRLMSYGVYVESDLKVPIPPKKWKTDSCIRKNGSSRKRVPLKGREMGYTLEEKED